MAKKGKYNTLEQLSAMKVGELKAIAPDFGVIITKEMKKADVIKAIFDSEKNTYIDADAPSEANAVKAEAKKPVLKRLVKVKRRNFQ